MKILLLGKANDPHCQRAVDYLALLDVDLAVATGDWGDPLPKSAETWKGDLIISYLSRWIVPDRVLSKASFAAINFHPAPPSFPGAGCVNFALYEEVEKYGVTCHHMAPQVDTGSIIATKEFPITNNDTVESLLARTYDFLLALFYEIVDGIQAGNGLPESSLQWSREPFTKKQLEDLYTINPDFSSKEIAKRVRATSFRHFQPRINLHGFNFVLENMNSEK